MKPSQLNRRAFLVSSTTAAGALAAGRTPAHADANAPKRYQDGISPWPLVMNTSTIRPASLEDKLRVTAEAGWDGIELWINELEEHEKSGGNLKELGQRIKDMGLYVPNIIGLWDAMPSTPEGFEASLPATRERMRRSSEVGSLHVAAIPAPDREDFDLNWGAEMYRELMRIGREDYNLQVAFEFVGFMKGVHRLGQACAVALDANDSKACLIMDTFHLFRGGSGFNALGLIQGALIANFHFNDVPGDIPREEQGDEHRLYPGDGILPLAQVLQSLKAIGYEKALSLEIFKRDYWELPPAQVAADGLRKTRESIAAAGV
ncbi:MAG: Inosose isomerase [Candidatus Hydrogenedentes bacterium ADurb.Bin101]|jgi:sugar phosphate isomerase/epimerase|nr:sugar phosphate isomerase/epimerase [Candidatus Hydrogenedentota bacterium]OQC05546.1 MAG: Inosose isomerase [Candidatus Hydrogenedentes bacterium ADurb.Bin101]HOC70800.1 sugar phosphate isomerase/epimerase [Candidatus Hydrogenedentota bacterium]